MTHRHRTTLQEKDPEYILLSERLKTIFESDEIAAREIDEFAEFSIVYVTLPRSRKLCRKDLQKVVLLSEFEGIYAYENSLMIEFHFAKSRDIKVEEEKAKKFKFFN